MRAKGKPLRQQKQQLAKETSSKAPDNLVQHPSPNGDKLSQADFCIYLGENFSNVGAKARRQSLSIEDYLKTVAQERKGEFWTREPGTKGKWVKQ